MAKAQRMEAQVEQGLGKTALNRLRFASGLTSILRVVAIDVLNVMNRGLSRTVTSFPIPRPEIHMMPAPTSEDLAALSSLHLNPLDLTALRAPTRSNDGPNAVDHSPHRNSRTDQPVLGVRDSVTHSEPQVAPAELDLVEAFDSASLESVRQIQHQLDITLPRVLPTPNIISVSVPMTDLMEQMQRVADVDLTVLLTGESGTGKSMLARRIHASGPRADYPFVVINCSSLPSELIESELFGHAKGAFTGASSDRRGRIEAAEGGTIFLDEIGELPLALQPKLLTFLQDQTFQRLGCDRPHRANVRVIAATHRDLNEACRAERFRQDLYFRLAVLKLEVPPLRERSEEIEPLIAQVLSRRFPKNRPSIDRAALARLMRHPWPGNVRELENVLSRAAVFCRNGMIREEDLVFDSMNESSANELSRGIAANGSATDMQLRDEMLAGRNLEDLERRTIEATLRACKGNKTKAARQLGISERSVYNKIAKWQLAF